jgi:hypothetical protein
VLAGAAIGEGAIVGDQSFVRERSPSARLGRRARQRVDNDVRSARACAFRPAST